MSTKLPLSMRMQHTSKFSIFKVIITTLMCGNRTPSLSFSMKVIGTTHLLVGCYLLGWWHPPVTVLTNPNKGRSPFLGVEAIMVAWPVGMTLTNLLTPSNIRWSGRGALIWLAPQSHLRGGCTLRYHGHSLSCINRTCLDFFYLTGIIASGALGSVLWFSLAPCPLVHSA